MLILILFISIVLSTIALFTSDDVEIGMGISALGIFIFVIGIAIITIFYPYNVDKRIAMYEEENTKIEEKVKNTVRIYMEFEKETYTNLVEEADLTTLLVAYPDLNSNELVKGEVDLYIENNNQIKRLKERQITRSTMRWWLYFGK